MTRVESRSYSQPHGISRHEIPHLRCGICDEPFRKGDRRVYLDDERVHPACRDGESQVRWLEYPDGDIAA